MPIKYVGRKTNFVGKSLWEIVGNLKDFGVGRLIVRGSTNRYPEPCYFKICKVEALENEEPRRVNVLTQKIFRGRKYSELFPICAITFKADFQLVPKDEEESYLKFTREPKDFLLPRTAPLPPLLRELVVRDMKAKGLPVTQPCMELKYRQSIDNEARIAPEGTKPSFEVNLSLGKPANPQLYKGVL